MNVYMYNYIAFSTQIESTKTVEDLRKKAYDNLDLLLECGFHKPLTKIELCDRVNIIQAIT